MERIRTIKPNLGRHGALLEAERAAGLPAFSLRLAYALLWCHCDREGRFKWSPLDLKAAIFPNDDIDFAAILNALAREGFVIGYRGGRDALAWIPTFKRNQQINGREEESRLPPPPWASYDDIPVEFDPRKHHEEFLGATGEPRVNATSTPREPHDTAGREGKGMDGKGKEGKRLRTREPRVNATSTPRENGFDFEEFWKRYRALRPETIQVKAEALKAWSRALAKKDTTLTRIENGLKLYSLYLDYMDSQGDSKRAFIPGASVWLNRSGWTAEYPPEVFAAISTPSEGRDFWQDWKTENESGATFTRSYKFWIRGGEKTTEPFKLEQWQSENGINTTEEPH